MRILQEVFQCLNPASTCIFFFSLLDSVPPYEQLPLCVCYAVVQDLCIRLPESSVVTEVMDT